MKFSRNAESALKQGDTRQINYELTPELRQKWGSLMIEITELLKAKTDGPIEGYCVLSHMLHQFEESYGIRGSVILEKDDKVQ